MNNELMIFEGQELEILTKEDVNIDFDGTVLFGGKQSALILSYSNTAKAIADHVDDDCKLLLKNSDITKRDFRKLNNAGEIFITEDGVFDLIYNSKLPKAKKFKKKVREIIKIVQQTGKFDSIENEIQQIEDDKERELSLKLYQLHNILKTSPNDMLTAISYNQTKQELTQYKQNLKLKEQEQILLKQGKEIEDQKQKLENMFIIGDRVQFVHEVNRIARATGKQQSDIYSYTYGKLKDMYGINLTTRVKNKREELQNERLNNGQKPYAPATLKSKINNLTIADDLDIWNQLGRALNSVQKELLNN